LWNILMADSLKKDTKKMEERIDDIEKRMEQLLKKEKNNLLAEVDDAVHKKKLKMSNIDDEEWFTSIAFVDMIKRV